MLPKDSPHVLLPYTQQVLVAELQMKLMNINKVMDSSVIRKTFAFFIQSDWMETQALLAFFWTAEPLSFHSSGLVGI